MPHDLTGWVLSVEADEEDGVVVWLIGEDGGRYRLVQPFKTVFYIEADAERLAAVRKYLAEQFPKPVTGYTVGRELYRGPLQVLRVEVANPVAQQRIFNRLKEQFNHLTYYNANIPFSIRYCAEKGIFSMAHCRVQVGGEHRIMSIQALDSPWELSYQLPPVRQMTVEPDSDPSHAPPTCLKITTDQAKHELSLDDKPNLLAQFRELIQAYDPDLILAYWGDSWLFPSLFRWAEETGVAFNPNRDRGKKPLTKEALTFHSYGNIHYRASQTHLVGRWHIDPHNAGMTGGFSLQAAIELARVTGVSVQTAARNSPGSGFTAMQIQEALKRGVLVPQQKRQTECFKSAMQLNLADAGGMNYRPLVGLHRHVAELDFFSMYPSIMMTWNISGETVGVGGKNVRYVPQTGIPITQEIPGLVATVLQPLLAKRRRVKKALAAMDKDDPLYAIYRATADALKWLGYVSFGYQGFKNNLFGNIQAHEAITAIGREMLVTAKETAFEAGFKVLGANTDSLFVQKPGAVAGRDFQDLMAEIDRRTGLSIQLEGVFDWLVFLPSKLNPTTGVSARYFGKFDDGHLKVRGLAQRRSDSCHWVVDAEKEIMELLARELDLDHPIECVQKAIQVTRGYLDRLNREEIPIEDLVVQKRLTREPQAYTGISESGQAASQLAAIGKQMHSGQRVRFIYTHGGKSKVLAWDLPGKPNYKAVNKRTYTSLLLRTVYEILSSFGLSERDLLSLVQEDCRQLDLFKFR